MNLSPEGEIVRLQNVISDAIKAMDESRYGDARKILKTGADKPLMSETGVIAKDGGT